MMHTAKEIKEQYDKSDKDVGATICAMYQIIDAVNGLEFRLQQLSDLESRIEKLETQIEANRCK